jgi:hypothetical protein
MCWNCFWKRPGIEVCAKTRAPLMHGDRLRPGAVRDEQFDMGGIARSAARLQ